MSLFKELLWTLIELLIAFWLSVSCIIGSLEMVRPRPSPRPTRSAQRSNAYRPRGSQYPA